jgi:hypothetical protein
VKQMIVVRLNAKLMPLDRGEYFEDPLDSALKARGLGEVTGGGTAQTSSGEIEYCDIEVLLPDASPDALDFIVGTLEYLGAPKGSKLTDADSATLRQLGKAEGIAIYLNGTDLPDEVYSSCDADFVRDEFGRLLGTEGRVLSLWSGPTETALYMYGTSFHEMRTRLGGFLGEYPLCRNCRIAQVA